MKAPIVLAVDTPDLEIAKQWIASTQEYVSVYKLGLEFFLTFGQEGIRAIQSETDSDIFLDLKLHDIPHTVESATRTIASLAPRFLTVHASGGREMIKAAAEAAPTTDITAVTILTSLSESDLFEIGYANPALESAVALASMSVEAGARAIVSSPLEIAAIRSAVGPKPHIITPGVRPTADVGNDDQKRTMTPRDAIAAGASFVVIGRPITKAWSNGADAMKAKARAIAEEILN
jgi:orotidine-5'-phosphate decarboxylase